MLTPIKIDMQEILATIKRMEKYPYETFVCQNVIKYQDEDKNWHKEVCDKEYYVFTHMKDKYNTVVCDKCYWLQFRKNEPVETDNPSLINKLDKKFGGEVIEEVVSPIDEDWQNRY